MLAKPFIFRSFTFAEPSDLNKIHRHLFQISNSG